VSGSLTIEEVGLGERIARERGLDRRQLRAELLEQVAQLRVAAHLPVVPRVVGRRLVVVVAVERDDGRAAGPPLGVALLAGGVREEDREAPVGRLVAQEQARDEACSKSIRWSA
jgi:hypothetical protein